MAEREKVENVARCCDNALDLLIEIRSKIEQIIEFKKKHPAGSGDEQLRSLIGAYMKALDNLIDINSGVESAAEDVKKLCVEAQLLLTKGVAARKEVGIGLGVGGVAITEKEEEGDDDGSK